MKILPHTKEQWMSNASKELTEGISLSDLIIKSEYFNHDGFSFPDKEYYSGILPANEWSITANFFTTENKVIINSLTNGAESLSIKINEETIFEKDFDEVRFDYITTLLDYENENHLSLFYKYLDNQYPTFNYNDAIIITKNASEIPLNADVSQLAKKFQHIIEAIEKNENTIVFINHVGIDFFIEIVKLRACKIIFANICKAYERENVKLHIYSKLHDFREDFNQNLIRWTYMTLSAILGGSDFISILPWDSSNLNEARLAQNIQHLLKHESYLQYFTDATAGSYFIENATNQLVKKIWETIVM
jgi:hypothetical protein